MHSCSASSGKPNSNSLDCIVFFLLMVYLHVSVIYRCRCLCGNHYILTALIFAIVDALFQSNVSATCFSLNLQMLFSPPVMYKLHLHLAFSITCRYLPSKIVHPQLVLSMPCRCLPQKLCIFNFRKSVIVDISTQYPLSSI